MSIRTSMPTMEAFVISTTGKGTGTSINNTNNSLNVIKGNAGARVNNATTRAGNRGTTERTGRKTLKPTSSYGRQILFRIQKALLLREMVMTPPNQFTPY